MSLSFIKDIQNIYSVLNDRFLKYIKKNQFFHDWEAITATFIVSSCRMCHTVAIGSNLSEFSLILSAKEPVNLND